MTGNISTYFSKSHSFSDAAVSGNCNLQSIIEGHGRADHQNFIKNLSVETFFSPLPNGELPLHYAIRKKSLPVVTWILSLANVDLSQRDHQGLTALDHAFIDSNQEIQKLAFNHCFIEQIGNTDIQASISHEKYESIASWINDQSEKHTFELKLSELLFFPKEYLNRDILVSDGNHTSYTTYLMSAIAQDDQKAIDLLLSKGVDIKQKVDHGVELGPRTTPLHLASFKGNLKTIESLIEKGADVNIKDSLGYTPLHYAILNRHFEAIKILTKNGANFLIGTSSPLAFMIANAKHHDPLKLNSYDLMTFCFSIAAVVSSHFITDQKALQNMFGAQFIVASLISWVINIWQGNLSESHLTLFNLALSFGFVFPFGNNFLSEYEKLIQTPILFISAILTSSIAVKKLAKCWKNRHLDSFRSIRNAIIQSTNSLAPIFKIYKAYFASPTLLNHEPKKTPVNSINKEPFTLVANRTHAVICNRVGGSSREGVLLRCWYYMNV